MVRRLVALLVFVAFVFAGCLGGGELDPDGSDVDDDGSALPNSSDTDDGNNTADVPGGNETIAPEPNRAPVANLNASALEGDAPLSVSFTLDATDPDGDALSWALDLGDGTLLEGDELPYAVDHEFQSGTYLVVFNVTDGEFHHAVNLTVDSVRLPNPPQEGSITLCQKHYILPAVFGFVPFDEGETVDVEAGTGWKVTASGSVQIQFWNDGQTIEGFKWATEGIVPGGANQATICVAPAQTPVYTAPTPGATFTYQDGFPV